MKFSELYKVLNKQDLITIKIINGELYHGQLNDLNLENFYNLQNQNVFKIQNEIIEIGDEHFVNMTILLDYVLRFGVENE